MVLLITHSTDFYTVDIVQQHLHDHQMATCRLNTDEFALRYLLQYTLLQDGFHSSLSIDGDTIHVRDIQAVWYRKWWSLNVPNDLDAAYKPVFTREYHTYLQLFFNQLQHLPWINPLAADHAAGQDKCRQLAFARQAGLHIPQTIFTNEPGIIYDFFAHCRGEMIVKLHNALSQSMEGGQPFFPTTKLTAGDLENLETLTYCPMIFQEYIPKAYELRIVYIDGVFYTGKIPYGDDQEKTDWRTIKGAPVAWDPYELPLLIQQKLTVLMQRLNLVFGAIDMIRHRNGSYVFLEVNPQGEWGMLQKYLEYPIGETIAEKLITRIQNG